MKKGFWRRGWLWLAVLLAVAAIVTAREAESRRPVSVTRAAVSSAAPSEAPQPTPSPLPSPDGDIMVWIPASGSKYHSRPDCSGMKDPDEVTLEHALELGYEPCSRCW